jgi:site-specific DNA-cytosine methylase
MSTTITATDLFCGAGGSSAGLHRAGIDVVMAANHWDLAIKTHNTNFPNVRHDCADISQVDPRRYPRTDVLWVSPSCTNHSIAKAAARQQGERKLADGELYPPLPAEAAERSRATMWDVVRFAEHHAYQAVIVENVIDAAKWTLFDAWLRSMHALGYTHKIVWLNSAFAGAPGEGAPQSRDRMYVVFWKGMAAPDLRIRPKANCANCGVVDARQAWKKHKTLGYSPRPARYKQQYVYRCMRCAGVVEPYALPAASAIDWSIRGQRIGDRKTPLADGTMRRIQAGRDKFWDQPLLVPLDRNNDPNKQARSVHELFPTQTARATVGIAFPPYMVEMRGGSSDARAIDAPLATVTAGGNHLWMVTPPGFVSRNNGSHGDGGEHNTSFGEPFRTLTTAGHQSVVTLPPHMLVPYYRTGVAASVVDPMSTVTTKARHMLVGVRPDLADCEFRMLEPHEIQKAMAFPDDYIVHGTKRERTRQYGNAVTPPAAEELIRRVAAVLHGEELVAA